MASNTSTSLHVDSEDAIKALKDLIAKKGGIPAKKARNPYIDNLVLHGRLGEALQEILRERPSQRVIRAFLSSTFTDTSEERNMILKDVAPVLQELFAEFGYEFYASEMRWSIREEESNHMETSAICMAELANCQTVSAGLNYIYFACSKYGFRPPPQTIPKAKFYELLEVMSQEEQTLANKSYKLDTNSTTTPERFKSPLPGCGPSRQVREEWDQRDGPQYVLQIGTTQWVDFISLVSAFRGAAKRLWEGVDSRDPKSCHWLKKFIISVTEEELSNGLLWANPEEGRTRIKVMQRLFEGGVPASDPAAGSFIDLNGEKEVDVEAQELLRQQHAMTKPDRVWRLHFAAGKGIDPTRDDHRQYLEEVRFWMLDAFIESLLQALACEVLPDQLVEEVRHHLEFALARAGKFHDTPTAVRVLNHVSEYVRAGNNGKAFVVWGKSGAGKTYIMSKAVWDVAVSSTASNGVCVVRFLGTTAESSKVSRLLESVVRQLARAYDKSEEDVKIPPDFRDLAELFKTAVTTWPTQEKPLTLVLDSVDQLDGTNGGRNLKWLPTKDLPECVRMLVSTLPDCPDSDDSDKKGFACYSRLRHSLENEDACFSKVEDIEDPEAVIFHLLGILGRTLTAEQMKVVLAAFNSQTQDDKAGTPLWLTLVANLAAPWQSDHAPPPVPTSVRGLIVQFFERLVKLRGEKLVRKVLACITLCKEGVSEAELAHLLSLDDDVLEETYEWWVPPARKVPCIVVTRLVADLAPYLAHRGTGSAMGWYHRQFWEAAEAWLFEKTPKFKEDVHEDLAAYFAGIHHGKPKPYSPALQEKVQKFFPNETAANRLVPANRVVLAGDLFDMDAAVVLNERRLAEHVHHCICARMQDETKAELTSPMYITCKFMAGMGTELQLELNAAIERFPDLKHVLQQVKAFIGNNIGLCRSLVVKWDVVQAAMNQPDKSPVRMQLYNLDSEGRSKLNQEYLGFEKKCILWRGRPQNFNPCILTLPASETVRSVAYASDGERVAYGCGDASITVCSLTTGDVLCTLTGHSHWVVSVAFSPDGKSLASGSWDKTVKVWDPDAGTEKISLGGHAEDNPECICKHKHEKDKVLGSISCIYNHECPVTGHTGAVNSVAFSPDGKSLASGSSDKTVKVWDVDKWTEKCSLTDHSESVNSVAFSPDGQFLASGSTDETVKVWDLDAGTVKCSLTGHSGAVFSVAFSPDGKSLASGNSGGTVEVWDPDEGTEKSSLTEDTSPSNPLLWLQSPINWTQDLFKKLKDSVTSAAGLQHPQLKCSLSGHNEENGCTCTSSMIGEKNPECPVIGHFGPVSSVVFSPDSKLLASGSWDNTVKVWDLDARTVNCSLTGHSLVVLSVAFSPDGKSITSGSNDKTVKVWDLDAGTQKSSLTGHSDQVNSVVFSPDGESITSGSIDWTVKVWDPDTGTEKYSLTGHSQSVNSVVFSPDGKSLASVSGHPWFGSDPTVKVWDPDTGTEKCSLTKAGVSVAFSPDSKSLASVSQDWIVSDTTVKVWDPDAGTEKCSFRGHIPFEGCTCTFDWGGCYSGFGTLMQRNPECPVTGHSDNVTSVAFSPDGKFLASGSCDATVKVWDLDAGTVKCSLTGHSDGVKSVAFSPDCKSLASGSCDKTVKVWDVDTWTEKCSLRGHSEDNPECICKHEKDKVLGSISCIYNHKCPVTGHSDDVTSVAFSPDSASLASGSKDGTVKIWDPEAGTEKCSLIGARFCLCPPEHIATAISSDIRVYQLSGKIEAHLTAPSGVTSIACNGNRITAGCVMGEMVHLEVPFLGI